METGLAGRENGRKKSGRDRMMRSKSFDIQEVKEISSKEAGELRGFWMEIIEDVFQMEGNKCKVQERLKIRRKSMPEQRRCFSTG